MAEAGRLRSARARSLTARKRCRADAQSRADDRHSQECFHVSDAKSEKDRDSSVEVLRASPKGAVGRSVRSHHQLVMLSHARGFVASGLNWKRPTGSRNAHWSQLTVTVTLRARRPPVASSQRCPQRSRRAGARSLKGIRRAPPRSTAGASIQLQQPLLMRQALRLPLPSSRIAAITRNGSATRSSSSISPLVSARTNSLTAPTARSFSTARPAMSLLRPSSFFSSPLDDFDMFPSSSLRDLMLMNPFAAAAAGRPNVTAGDYRIWSGPKVDLHEEDTKFVLTAELPGVKKEDVKINVDADRRRLTLEGHLKSEYSSQPAAANEDAANGKEHANAGDKGASSTQVTKKEQTNNAVGHALVSERVYGSFSRSFTLPVTADLANDSSLKARFNDGLLRLEIPKKKEEHSKTRQIAIETA
ncbi:chromatin remodeling complex WSTF-ISWI, small subunit [Moesziomyces antarcticus T-34]|uniref:Chromatin remodeling complex WSTF-ISWI, small subunit n=1 Tax=Pseudozyma antarctica (strain T-34) TaxID=1151754 RepID=M9LQI6_PSEA3|nr:chromatin remodeling complex WSTF-ISWI, small subunit [Moesziomyces antarcticus T-34]